MVARNVLVVYPDRTSFATAWGAGLRHGLVNVQLRPVPAVDDICEIEFELAFVDRRFVVEGAVVQSSDVATSIMLSSVPAEMDPAHLPAETSPPPPGPPPRPKPPRVYSYDPDAGPRPSSTDPDRRRPSRPPPASADPDRGPTPRQRLASIDPDVAERPPRRRSGRRTAGSGGAGIQLPRDPSTRVRAAVRLQGDLRRTPTYRVLLQVVARRVTGVALLSVPGATYWLALVDGALAWARAEPPSALPALEAWLGRDDAVAPERLDEVRLLVDLTGESPEVVARQLGLLDSAAAVRMHRARARAVVEQLLARGEGSYQVYELPRIARALSARAVPLLPLLFDAADEEIGPWDEAQRRAKSRGMEDRLAVLTEMGRRIRPRLPLAAERRDLLATCEAGIAVPALLRAAGEEADELVRTLLVLHRLGVLELPQRDPTLDEEEETSLDRLLHERVQQLARDHFAFLDLHWTALPEELLERADRVERQLRSYDNRDAPAPDYAEHRDQLRQRVGTIRRLARSDAERKRYRVELLGEDRLRMAAEQLVERADMALYRDDVADARDSCLRALELDDGSSAMVTVRRRAKRHLARLKT